MLDQTSVRNKGYSQNIIAGIDKKTKEFKFVNDIDDDMRPTSKESDSRTSTSTPFGNLRNNLNSTDYEGKGNLNINDDVHNFLDSLKLNKY